MLSIHTMGASLGKVADAVNYFLKEADYYGNGKGTWFGDGAERLNLKGEINKEDFQQLLEGKIPGGPDLARNTQKGKEHRMGYDCCFSAPKSFSILSQVGGDERLTAIQEKATKYAAEFLQQHAAQAVQFTDGKKGIVDTNNLTMALFPHFTSRADDPNVHTHCIVVNTTQREDGKWNCLVFDNAYNLKMTAGLIYRSKLIEGLKEIGYEIELSQKGLFEIKGFSRQELELFSQRRMQIQERLNELGMSSAKAASVATLDTRESKNDIDQENLRQVWRETAEGANMDIQGVIDQSYKRLKQIQSGEIQAQPQDKAETGEVTQLTRLATVAAVGYLAKHDVIMHESQIIRRVLESDSNLISIHPKDIVATIEAFESEGQLIKVGENAYTTQHAVQLEQRIVGQMKAAEGLVTPYLKERTLNKVQHLDTVSTKEAQTIEHFTQSKDRFVGVKTSGNWKAIAHGMHSGASSENKRFIVVTQDAERAKNYRQEGIESYSLTHFLNHSPKDDHRQTFVMIEGAQRLSNIQVEQVQTHAVKNQWQVGYLGKTLDIASYQAGQPFQLLQKQGLKMHIDSSSKLSNNSPLNAALYNVEQNKILDAFKAVGDNLHEIQDRDERIQRIAGDYTRLSHIERIDAAVVATSRLDQSELTSAIRQRLHDKGDLGHEITTTRLTRRLDAIERPLVNYYNEGDFLQFFHNQSKLGIQKGDYAKVMSVNRDNNMLVVKTSSGKLSQFNPGLIKSKFEVYKAEESQLAVGDRIRFTKRMTEHQIKAESAIVLGIKDTQVRVKTKSGQEVSFDSRNLSSAHWTHDYVQNASKLKPVSRVFALFDQRYEKERTKLYNVLSSAKSEAHLYVDNTLKTVKSIEDSEGVRLSALESIERYKGQPKEEITPLQRIVKDSVAIHAEREHVYLLNDVVKTALTYSLDKFSHEQVEGELKGLINNKELMTFNSKKGLFIARTEDYEKEKSIIEITEQGKGKVNALLNPSEAKTYLEQVNAAVREKSGGEYQLTPTQASALNDILTSKNQIIIEQGSPGVGKTSIVPYLKKVAQDQGLEILGLAPSHQASRVLKDEIKENTQTVHKFVYDLKQQKVDPEQQERLLIVDEFSMIDTGIMKELLEQATAHNYRVLLQGDRKQLPSVGAGSPAALTQDYVENVTTEITDIVRQNKNPELKEAIYKTIEGDASTAFSMLKESTTIEVQEDKEEALKSLASSYLSSKDRDNFLVIVQSNSDKDTVNQLIRDGLKEEGSIEKSGIETRALVSKSLESAKQRYAAHYEVNDVILLAMDIPKLGLKKDEAYTVSEVNHNDNTITVKAPQGRTSIQLSTLTSQEFTLYSPEKRELVVGDKLVWKNQSEELGITKGTALKVEEISKNVITVSHQEKGKSEPTKTKIDLSNPKNQSWDYDFSATAYRSQGMTKYYGHVYLNSESPLSTIESFLVEISRFTQNLKMTIDNESDLISKLNDSPKKTSIYRLVHRQDDQSIDSAIESMKMKQGGLHDPKARENLIRTMEDNIQPLLSKLLGNPDSKSENIWHYKSGNIRIEFGSDRAYYRSNSTQKGNMFHLIKDHLGCNNLDTFKWIKEQVSNLKSINSEQNKKENLPRETKIPTQKKQVQKPVKEKNNNIFTQNRAVQPPKIDRQEEGRQLLTRMESDVKPILERLLGEPVDQSNNQWRYGAKGSLAVTFKGDRSVYFNHETGESGSLFNLLKQQLGCDTKGVYDWLRGYYGNQITQQPIQKTVNKKPKSIDTSDIDRRVKRAKKLEKESRPAQGTLAETYLRNRGITGPIPSSFRYIDKMYDSDTQSNYPALLVIAKNNQGETQAVQAVYLNKNTGNKARIKVNKRSIGAVKGAKVIVNEGDKNQPAFIAEGPETGLSILEAKPKSSVYVTLSSANFRTVELPDHHKVVVLARDNDGLNKQVEKYVKKCVDNMTSNGRVVLTAMPDQVKTDFNDVLQKQGCHKVESLLNNAKPYQNFINLNLSNSSKKEIISETIKSLQESKVSQPKLQKPKTIQRSVPEIEIDF